MNTPSPLATPLPWNIVAPGYTEVALDHFERYAADALAFAGVGSGDRVLDVAAGSGALALQAASIAREVAALDFSQEMLAQLRARASGCANLEIREGDGQALPWADGSFDATFSMFGLIFFPDRARGFSELFRVLRPGGRAVVSSWQPMVQVPLLVAVFEALAKELPQLPFGDGKGPLSDPDDFRREMSAAGFRVTIEERVHAIEAPDFGTLWGRMLRSNAPLTLLEHRMGPEAFAPVRDAIERRLRERFEGTTRVEMPAWLALGIRPG